MNHRKILNQLSSILQSLDSHLSEQGEVNELKVYIKGLLEVVEAILQHDKRFRQLTSVQIFGKNSVAFTDLINSQFNSLQQVINHLPPFNFEDSSFYEHLSRLLETATNIIRCFVPSHNINLNHVDGEKIFNLADLAACFTKDMRQKNLYLNKNDIIF